MENKAQQTMTFYYQPLVLQRKPLPFIKVIRRRSLSTLRHPSPAEAHRYVKDGCRRRAEFSEGRRFRASVASPAPPFPVRVRDLDLAEERT